MGFLDFLGDLIGPAIGGAGDLIGEGAGAIEDIGRSVGTALPNLPELGAGAVGAIGESGPAGASTGELFDIGKIASQGGSFPSLNAAGDAVWGGLKGGWQGLGEVAKGVAPFAGIGAAGLGAASSIRGVQAANEQNKILRRAQGLQERAATPLTNFGEAQLRAAQAGTVPPAVKQQIALWANGAKQKAHDYLARADMGNSSTATSWDSWIDQQAQAMEAQYLQTEAQQGIGALQGASSAAGQLGAGAEHQQSSIDQLIAAANSTLNRLSAGAA